MTDINYPASGGGGGAGGAVDLNDGAGNPITSQVSGSKRALDVGIDVAGVQVDPRQIRALTISDVVSAAMDDGAGNALTSQVSGTQRALDVGVNVAGVQVDPRAIRALTASDVISANMRMDVSGTPTAVPGNSLGLLTSTPYATYIGTMAAPTTGVIISSIDCANYRFISFNVTTTAGSFAIGIQGSNDNINWFSHPFNTLATPNSVINTTAGAAGIYTAAILTRYIRLNVTTNVTGTITATAVVFDNTRIDPGAKYIVQSGTSTTTTYFAGRVRTLNLRYNYASGTVTTSAYTQILASLVIATSNLWIADTSGSAIILATGAAGSESDQLYIPPGGFESYVYLSIANGVRLSIKALDVNASSGQLIINGLA
jgi:hypothetical protein